MPRLARPFLYLLAVLNAALLAPGLGALTQMLAEVSQRGGAVSAEEAELGELLLTLLAVDAGLLLLGLALCWLHLSSPACSSEQKGAWRVLLVLLLPFSLPVYVALHVYADGGPPAGSEPYDLDRASRTVQGLALACIALNLGSFSSPEPEQAGRLSLVAGIAQLFLMLRLGLWMHHAYANVQEHLPESIIRRPTWGLAGFTLPYFHLFVPAAVLYATWNANYARLQRPAALPLWLGLHWFSLCFATWVDRWMPEGADPEVVALMSLSAWLVCFSSLVYGVERLRRLDARSA